ncbi:unnamed protein product [Orchesella dallaii]|uniref:Galectin n=1 Tax=Orchesella dallaii TaxID=48710 RepID=A0ABP1S657_9HEXA
MIIQNLNIPFITQISPVYLVGNEGKGLTVGTVITILGRVLPNANRFDINLCKDGGAGSAKPFHFNPRFAPYYEGIYENAVVLNTKSTDEGWGDEERKTDSFPFLKGECFKIEIRCENDHFSVSVDGKPFIDYKYRSPLKDCNFLEIAKQVEISSIEVKEQDKMSNLAHAPLCECVWCI